ncbi:MAG: TonB-dependent receptor, partial [Bacteroidetes bacterium]|nr:TonB-dependent receptor [Bacteroidota bacterium]
QTNAILKGIDFYLNYTINKSFEITSKASILRAWNKKENNWLIMMPSDRYEAEITYRFKKYKKINNAYISSSFQYVTKQWRVPANSDFVPPPSAYYLVNLHASFSVQVKNQNIEFGVSVFNLLNKSYRDYLDRFRYFTDAMGRNITFRIKVPFNIGFKSKSINNNN